MVMAWQTRFNRSMLCNPACEGESVVQPLSVEVGSRIDEAKESLRRGKGKGKGKGLKSIQTEACIEEGGETARDTGDGRKG